jgi:hypothetical protein
MRSGAALALAAGLAVLLSTAGNVSAFTGNLDIVLVVDKSDYRVGEWVNATVYVMDGGALADADSVSLVVESGTYPAWRASIDVVRIATGTYHGNFEILANMTGDWIPGIGLGATATRGGFSDTDSSILNVPAQHTIWTQIALSKYTVAPGEEVWATVWTYFNGELRDPKEVNVSAVIGGVGLLPTSRQYLQAENISLGTFRAAYTIPSGLDQSTAIEIWAKATYVWQDNTGSFLNSVPLRVAIGDPFNVWYHQVGLTNESARLEIGVADRDGVAVTGATVHLESLYCPSPEPCRILSLENRTDSRGLAPFEVTRPWPYDPDLLAFVFWGYVTTGAANQTFSGSLSAPARENPFIALRLRRDNPTDLFSPGETVLLKYTALAEGRPLPDAALDYDIHSATALAGYGRSVTDSAGRFTLNFTMPTDPVAIEVVWQDGSVWSYAGDSVAPALPWSVHLDPFQVGRSSRLAASLPSAGAPWAVSLALYPYNESEFPMLRPDWSEAHVGGGIFWDSKTMVVEGSALDISLTLPRYLPGNRMYVLSMRAFSINGSSPLPFVYSDLVYVSEQAPSEESAPFLAVGVAAIGVGAAIIIAYVWTRKRTPTPVTPASGSPDGADLGEKAPPPPQPPKT